MVLYVLLKDDIFGENNFKKMKLSELKNNEKGVIVKVKGRGAFRKRIIEMGFIKGKTVTVIKNAPLKDPVEYNIMGYEISLRRSEADLIEVINIEEAKEYSSESNGIFEIENFIQDIVKEKRKHINVALVGNPNSGKTTLFNYASGSKEHVGNYSGVTVDAKNAKFFQNGFTFNITDLPGTYSLTAYSPEELFVRKYIVENVPDVVVNVIDASNLERNLYLTTQLIDMDIKVVIALNMYDELIEKGAKFDYQTLGEMIGIPIVPTVASKGKGIPELFCKVVEVYEDRAKAQRHIHINYGKETENSIKAIQEKIKIHQNAFLTDRFSSRFLAIKLLEKDKDAKSIVEKCHNSAEINDVADKNLKKLEEYFREEGETIITDAKYGFIAGALKETYKEGNLGRQKRTEIIDTFLTHKLFGFPIFIFFVWLTFQSTFSLGQYPMAWIEWFVETLGNFVNSYMADGMLKDLLIDGIIGGVGGVIVFLPNILILFFFISLMEDTGYMARVAFIMDKIMHKIGLHGKSFIPLLMGFGCNVPAIMSTRTLENRNDRLLTMLINPFMSCSARLPVYLVVIGAFFPKYSGFVLFSVYGFGILMAIVVALIFKKFIFKNKEVPFVMELPPYRIPTFRSTLKHMWNKGKQYLKKMGGVILVASIIIWALGYFPKNEVIINKYDKKIDNLKKSYSLKIENEKDKTKKFIAEKDSLIKVVEKEKFAELQANSYIGKIGKFVQPIMQPLGFDWKMTVSILTGVAAKEIVVSTMGVLYQVSDYEDEAAVSLQEKLKNETYESGSKKGEKVFNPVVALAFILFVLIYFPCVAVIAAIKKESGSWKWALFTMAYTTSLAWMVAFLVYQIGSLLFL